MLRKAGFSVCALLVALVLCVGLPAQTQSSSSTNANKNTTSTKNSQQNNSQHKMDLSQKTVHALRLTAEARQALIDKNQSRAKTDVDQALNLMNQVADKDKTSGTDIVPIYAELEQTSFLAPVLSAKNNTQDHQQSASNSSTNTDNSTTQIAQNTQSSALPQSDQPASAKQPDVVKWVEGGYSYIGLDVNQARQHLQAAQQALNRTDSGQADLELARAEQAVDTGTTETNMPLVRARENLTLARADLKNGNTKEAKADLTAASRALEGYSSNAQVPHATDAKNLSQQIKSSSASLSNNSASSQKIDNWWNKLADWTGQKTS
jgi:hypothetical protein